MGTTMNHDDICQIYEAVAYVISCLSLEDAALWLKTFSTDILSSVHAIISKPTEASKEDLQLICSK